MTTFQQGLMISEVAIETNVTPNTAQYLLTYFNWNKDETIEKITLLLMTVEEVKKKCDISDSVAKALLFQYKDIDLAIKSWPIVKNKFIIAMRKQTNLSHSKCAKLLNETKYELADAYLLAKTKGLL